MSHSLAGVSAALARQCCVTFIVAVYTSTEFAMTQTTVHTFGGHFDKTTTTKKDYACHAMLPPSRGYFRGDMRKQELTEKTTIFGATISKNHRYSDFSQIATGFGAASFKQQPVYSKLVCQLT